MAVKKKTENQKAYQKERRRLLQAVRRAEKQGYTFPEDIVPDIPKRVTKKRLVEIQGTKPSDIYKVAQYVYKDTGEIVPASQREAKPPVPISFRKNEVLRIFDDTVTFYEMNENISEYESYLKDHESEIADLLNVISYDSDNDNINASFVSLGRLLNVTSLSVEQAENLSAMTEYYS